MPSSEKQSRSDSNPPDLACTRCRERKIRCDRERPQCSNCERDDEVTCVYQNPPKRVNHLKLLSVDSPLSSNFPTQKQPALTVCPVLLHYRCDSVDQLQDRLANIELHLKRLTVGTSPNSRSNSSGPESVSGSRRNAGDDEQYPDSKSPSPETSRSSEGPESHDPQRSITDRHHGPLPLVVLCNHFRLRAQSISNGSETGLALAEMLQNVCETAAVTEPFPPYSDESPVQLLPKQQALAAIGRFLQYTDCITDIFVPSHLLANLERIYSQPLKPSDDAWATCFKAITLLVFGMEISTQESNPTLFGDFARSLLPSRVALVTSRLLTTPSLINVQTLILLSVAAQQFDPPGWAELIFAHACMLARTMGLHNAQLLPTDASADETVERAKVLQSLYARDRGMCTTRGSVSWLPSHDCDIVSQLTTAIERRVPHSERLRLAVIQDEIYLLAQLAHGRRSCSSKRLQGALQSIEQQLEEYARAFGIFQPRSTYSARQVLMPMEFLTTRILALRHGLEPRHIERVRSDAKACCLLLLIAHEGEQDPKAIEEFHALTDDLLPPRTWNPPANEPATAPFANPLDAFSVPAFFILLETLLRSVGQGGDGAWQGTDIDLLRRVSLCCSKLAARMQPNSYYCKVAWVFDQLLIAINFLKKGQAPLSSTSPGDDIIMGSSGHSRPPPLPNTIDIPSDSSRVSIGDMSNMSGWPLSTASTALIWDSWLSVPSSLGPATPAGPMEHGDVSTPSADLLAQLLSTPHNLVDHPEVLAHFHTPTSNGLGGRKRPRLDEHLGSATDGNGAPAPSEAMPFHLIS